MKINIVNFNNGHSFSGRKKVYQEPIREEFDNTYLQYVSDLEKIKPLLFSEEKELAKDIAKGGEIAEKARQRLIEGNLKYVIHFAKRYVNRGVPLMDLIQEGNMGLYKAAYSKDYDGSCKFINMAYLYIRNRMIQALVEKSNIIRIPIHAQNNVDTYLKTEEELEQRYLKSIPRCYVYRKTGVHPDYVSRISALKNPVSIEDKIAKTPEHDEFLISDNPPPCASLDEKMANERFYWILDKIGDPKKSSIIQAYGLFGSKEVPQVNIARKNKQTGAAVYEQIKSGIRYMQLNRNTRRIKPLIEYLRGKED